MVIDITSDLHASLCRQSLTTSATEKPDLSSTNRGRERSVTLQTQHEPPLSEENAERAAGWHLCLRGATLAAAAPLSAGSQLHPPSATEGEDKDKEEKQSYIIECKATVDGRTVAAPN